MNFSDIPGQSSVIDRLRNTVKEQRVSHAMLFYGPEGSGKFAIALAFARYVSCDNRTATEACGKCPSCLKYDKLIHPDLHFVFPVLKKKNVQDPVSDLFLPQWREMVLKSPWFSLSQWTEAMDVVNEQASIFVAEAGEIVRKLNLKTFEADYKVMIIWLPEKMNSETANKLLKMIEEPPEKTLFLLVSEEDDKLLPTIVSRCQPVRIPAVSHGDMAAFLLEKYHLTHDRALDIAGIANGNMVRAIALASDADGTAMHLDRFRKLMRVTWTRDMQAVVAWSEETAALGRERQKSFLSYSLRLLRENFVMNFGGKEKGIVYLTAEEASFSSKFYPFINEKNIEQLNREFNLAFAHVESNGNAKMIFLDLALKTMRLIR